MSEDLPQKPLDTICPNCSRLVEPDAVRCPQCDANFGVGSAWRPRHLMPGEVPAPDKMIQVPNFPLTNDAPTAKVHWLVWLIGLPVGIFVLMMVYFAITTSPEKAALLSKRDRIDEACEKMMADSALGSERRTTRAVCDQMKADVQREIQQAK